MNNFVIVKKVLSVIFFILLSYALNATHNRAGEITYRQLSGLTFQVTITTYTATGPGPCADRPELDIYWGDNTQSTLPRVEETELPDYYKKNVYKGVHTYPGPGLYSLVVEDPNRNYGVDNIPNSVNTVFCISTTMYINPAVGTNNTPILTREPLDKASVGHLFVHNPGAYDPDGDSIAYRLTRCRSDNGQEISGYSYPPATDTLYIDPITGDFVWRCPTTVGVYNVAMIIEEWRNGVKIDEIIRDMQIQVYEGNINNPPVIEAKDYICVVAGDSICDTIIARDVDNNTITLTATGDPISSDFDSWFQQLNGSPGEKKGVFQWNTNCSNIRKQTYSVVFKAVDNNSSVPLANMKTLLIKVIGPQVENLNCYSTSNHISLSWDANVCNNAVGYNIYRKINSTHFQHDSCETGIPVGLGYEKIAYVDSWSTNTYTDYDVLQGLEYCYRICAVWEDNTALLEGYASDEICCSLKRGIPTITNVSVEETDENIGKIYIAWAKPKSSEIDENANGPYQYILYRSIGLWGENPVQVHVFNDINDTIFYDTLLNTTANSYSYLVEFYNNEEGNRFLIGTPSVASSVFLDITSIQSNNKLSFEKNVPWINDTYVFYSYNSQTSLYDSIGYINNEDYFLDNKVFHNTENCYYIKSVGSYSVDSIINPIINYSQKKCIVYVDTFPPCPPILFVQSLCDSSRNNVHWMKNDTCNDGIISYELYYKPTYDSEFIKIYEGNDTVFSHHLSNSLAACYYVVAIDENGNRSNNSTMVCIDNCSSYKLPNVFTPNGDGVNDFFEPLKPYYSVDKVDMKIYNRWGQLIFETSDPDIEWNGRYMQNNKPVADGVYYYICDVYEQRLTGLEIRHLTGFVHVFSSTDYNIITK